MPNGALSKPFSTVVVSAEDGLADTLRPRLDAAGADLNRVFHLEIQTDDMLTLPGDIDQLRGLLERYKEEEIGLVVLDPFNAFLSNDVNSYNDHDIRRALGPLSKLAGETGVTFLLIRHFTKRKNGVAAMHMGGGSVGYGATVRSGLAVGTDPNNLSGCVLTSTKNNLGPTPESLSYQLENANR